MEHRLKPRKVIELPSKLIMAVNKRILVSNELRNVELIVEPIERLEGTRPSVLIRIKRRALEKKRGKKSQPK